MRNENLTRLAALAAALGLSLGSEVMASGWGKKKARYENCPTIIETAPLEIVPSPTMSSESAPDASVVAPQDAITPQDAVAPQDAMAAPPAAAGDMSFDDSLSGQYDVASASDFSAPNMIGDFFGNAAQGVIFSSDSGVIRDSFGNIIDVDLRHAETINLNSSPGTGGGVGRIKLAENTSILPRDRFYFNYQFFDSVPLSGRGTDVNRFVPGFEKTFFNGWTSVEVRVPFATTIDNVQDLNALGSNNVELGNVTVFLKSLLYQSDTFAFGAGLTITCPTANDLSVVLDGQEIGRVENEGTHLAPYLGAIWAPGRLFNQLYVQYDVDATGRPVFGTGGQSAPNGLVETGRQNDTSVLFLDYSVGYWVYQNNCCDALLRGIAPVFEVHYNQALGNGDINDSGTIVFADINDNFSIVNLTFGTHFLLGDRSTVTLAGGAPVTDDRGFNYEFHVLFNYMFGQVNRLTRTPGSL